MIIIKIVSAIKTYVRSANAKFAAAGAVLAGTGVALAGVSGATGTYDPTGALTSFADNFGTTAGPIIVVVATAFVGLAILLWGVKFAYGFVGTRIRTK